MIPPDPFPSGCGLGTRLRLRESGDYWCADQSAVLGLGKPTELQRLDYTRDLCVTDYN